MRPTLIRLPGYPLFLMACFKLFGMEHYHAVMFAQTAIDLGTCLILAAFTRRIWDERAGWWALWLAALCPFTANYAAVPLTETLELFSIAIALYALARFLDTPRWSWAILEALAWSYAALLRPDGALIAVALCPAMVWYGSQTLGRRSHGEICGRRALLSILPFIPWTIRNWRTFHVIQPLAPRYRHRSRRGQQTQASTAGQRRSASTSPARGRSTGTSIATSSTFKIYLRELLIHRRNMNETKQLLDDYNETTDANARSSMRDSQLLAAARIHAHPLQLFRWATARAISRYVAASRAPNSLD